jgi:hypothetical protein
MKILSSPQENTLRSEYSPNFPGNWIVQTNKNFFYSTSLHRSKLFADVEICLENSPVPPIPAHRCILALRSTHFEAMFRGNFRESSERHITLRNMNSEQFSKMIEFVYKGHVIIESVEMGLDLLEVADRCCIPSLMEFSANFLKGILTPENSCEILCAAKFFQ